MKSIMAVSIFTQTRKNKKRQNTLFIDNLKKKLNYSSSKLFNTTKNFTKASFCI